MPQLTIELDHEELERLHALAKRKRRTDAQQAAYSLLKYLGRADKGLEPPAPAPPAATVEAMRIQRDLAATPYDRAAAQYALGSAETKGATGPGLPPE